MAKVTSFGIGNDFIERTKFTNMTEIFDQRRGVAAPSLEELFVEGNVIDLPSPDEAAPGDLSFKDLVDRRVSLRNFSRDPLSLEELSYLLWCTQGVKKVHRPLNTFRTVPSAGARHAFETYLLTNRVEGLGKGLYRFLAVKHRLGEVNPDPALTEKITHACFDQKFVAAGAATFIWTAVVQRMKWRYGERSYRYLHLDAGHVCQNLYLAAESVGCGACAIGAYDDDRMNQLLGIDGRHQFVIYMATVGKRK